MRKKVLASLAAIALTVPSFTSAAFAKSPNATESIVALGDSITFGYNLGVNNDHPSKEAFPYLIQNDGKDFRVNDLGVPGWRSDQLLDALKNNEQFRQAVIHADVVTLDIGNNDLLQGLDANGPNPQALMPVIGNMLQNLTQNIAEIRKLTNAEIVVYDIYNPFQTDDPLHGLGIGLLPLINAHIQGIVKFFNTMGDKNIVLADAYTAFGENQLELVRQKDIHPTVQGQEVLAEVAEKALGLK